jgi:hypothetical protein
MSGGAVKKCRVCGRWKPVAKFYKHSRALDGLQSKCKECDTLHSRTRNDPTHRRDFGLPDASGVGRELPKRYMCPLCCGIPWRVEGERCANPRCGLPFAPEPSVGLSPSSGESSLARMLEA